MSTKGNDIKNDDSIQTIIQREVWNDVNFLPLFSEKKLASQKNSICGRLFHWKCNASKLFGSNCLTLDFCLEKNNIRFQHCAFGGWKTCWFECCWTREKLPTNRDKTLLNPLYVLDTQKPVILRIYGMFHSLLFDTHEEPSTVHISFPNFLKREYKR